MSLTLVRDKFTGKAHTALLVAIDGLILLMAIFVFTIGGFKLAVSASPRVLGAAGHPPQLGLRHRPDFRRVHCDCADINIYEDITGEKVESKEGADK